MSAWEWGRLTVFLVKKEKKTVKYIMALRTQFQMLILVQLRSHQLMFSFVTFWFCYII